MSELQYRPFSGSATFLDDTGSNIYEWTDHGEALRFNMICSVSFVGALNDLTVSLSARNYNSLEHRTFYVKIQTTGAADTFVWSVDNATWSDPITISAAATPILLAYKFYIEFGAVAGHVVGDLWTITPQMSCAIPELGSGFAKGIVPQTYNGFIHNVVQSIEITNGKCEQNNPRINATAIGDAAITGRLGDDARLLHQINCQRGAPFGWGTWRQLAYHYQSPVVRELRKHNIYFAGTPGTGSLDIDILGEMFREFPVSMADKPMDIDLGVLNGSETIDDVPLRVSYGAEQHRFDNVNIVNRLGVTEPSPATMRKFSNLYNSSKTVQGQLNSKEVVYNGNPKQIVLEKQQLIGIKNGANGEFRLNRIRLGETVFPKRKEAGWIENRKRTEFTEEPGVGSNGFDRQDYQEFWRDLAEDMVHMPSLGDRVRTDGTAINSQGDVIDSGTQTYPALSKWPLDTKKDPNWFALEIPLDAANITPAGSGVIPEVFPGGVSTAGLVDRNLTMAGVGWFTFIDPMRAGSMLTFDSVTRPLYRIGMYTEGMSSWDIEYSDDGLAWVPTGEVFIAAGGLGAPRWYYSPDLSNFGTHAWWRIIAQFDDASGNAVYELRLFEKIDTDEINIQGELVASNTLMTSAGPLILQIPAPKFDIHADHRSPVVPIPAPVVGFKGPVIQAVSEYMAVNSQPPLDNFEDARFRLSYNIPWQCGSSPWYDTYDAFWNENLKLTGVGYSNLAEFRISDSVDFYLKNGLSGTLKETLLQDSSGNLEFKGNYNTAFLSLRGSDNNSSDDGSGNLSSEFLSRYVYSDFIKYYGKLKSDEQDYANPSAMRLTLNTLVKPLPYMGFYPANRVVQLATLLHESFQDILDALRPTLGVPTNQSQIAMQTLLYHLLSPGLLLNAIKSGIAVDFPAFIGQDHYYNGTYIDEVSSVVSRLNKIVKYATAGAWGNPLTTVSLLTPPNTKIDFEALLDILGNFVPKNELIKNDGTDLTTAVYFDPRPQYNKISMLASAQAIPAATLLAGYTFEVDTTTTLPTFFYFNKNEMFDAVGAPPPPSHGWRVSDGVTAASLGSRLIFYKGTGSSPSEPIWVQNIRMSATVVMPPASAAKFEIQYSDDGVNWISTGALYDSGGAFGWHTSSNVPATVGMHLYWGLMLVGGTLDSQNYVELDPIMAIEGSPSTSTMQLSLAQNHALIPSKGNTSPKFEMSMHNFLAETVKFFLADAMVQYFMSQPESQFKSMEYGTVYYMDVVLKKKNVALCEGYQWSDSHYSDEAQLMLQQRGAPFGYPLNATGDQYTNQNYLDVRDPMYGAWTPPYFYGDSVARISFAPHEFDSTLQPGESKRYSLSDILKGAKIRTLKKTHIGGVKEYPIDNSNSYYKFYPSYDDDVFAENGFFNTIDWEKYQVPNATLPSYRKGMATKSTFIQERLFNSAIMYYDMMKIDASVKLWERRRLSKMQYSQLNPGQKIANLSGVSFEEATGSENDCWVIASKWESPVLDVSGHGYDTYTTLPSASQKLLSEIRRARSIWFDYAVLPKPEDGVFLELRESFPDRDYAKHPFADLDGEITGNAKLDILKQYSGQDEYMRHRESGDLFGSLIDVCGFQTGVKKIGRVADKKTVSEGVVAIPFTERDGKINFFPVDGAILQKQLENKFKHGYAWELQNGEKVKNTSITKTYENMAKFVIPPQFDYAKFTTVPPFVMYIFDISIDLSQQDLVDIWQNVMPESFKRVTKQNVEIEHRFEEYEFFHGQTPPDDIRFMVFKVKQRAEWNYWNTVPYTSQDKKFKFKILNEKGQYAEQEPQFSYNWPFDFMSLVELAKLDAYIEFEGK